MKRWSHVAAGARVARELAAVIARRGKPHRIVSDNGTELTWMAILRWQQECGVHWNYIQPGKPIESAFVESFNGRSGTSASTRSRSVRSAIPAR